VCPLDAPYFNNFCTPTELFSTSNCDFNFNFLAPVLSDILGGLKFTLGALCPLDTPSGKIFVPKASILPYLIEFLISTFYLQ